MKTASNPQENEIELHNVSSLARLFPEFSQKDLEVLDDIIENNKINLTFLRKFCYQGNLYHHPALRPLFWRLLLGYLPLDIKAWKEVNTLNKMLYQEYITEIFIKNDENSSVDYDYDNSSSDKSFDEPPKINKNKGGDHPLSGAKTSNWMVHFKNKDLWNMIEKDTRRTRSDDVFFSQMTKKKYPTLSKNNDDDNKKREGMEYHKDVMTRILFVFAKTHSYIKYVQGMNEILAPIYYCLAKANEPLFEDSLEEDCFTCFSLLMSEIKENFTKIKDCSLLGFKTRIMLLDKLLKRVDPKLWNHLSNFNIMTEIYSTRWILLLLTQDFNLESIMRIWDVLFSYQDKQEFVNFLSLAMIVGSREEIMKNSLEEIHLALRKISKLKLEKILELADSIANEYNEIGNENN